MSLSKISKFTFRTLFFKLKPAKCEKKFAFNPFLVSATGKLNFVKKQNIGIVFPSKNTWINEGYMYKKKFTVQFEIP